MGTTAYDSTKDTLAHISRVRDLMHVAIAHLHERAAVHDASKLREPEKALYDEYTPKLDGMEYSVEPDSVYQQTLRAMGPALQHHYQVNRHHPEFGETGIEWRAVVGYEGRYEVSSLGDVRSVDRVVERSGPTGNVTKQGQIRKANLTPKGYARIALVREGKQRNHMVHVLVATAFIPNPDDKPEVNHDNGIKHDNRVSNLWWATSSENQAHAYDTGLREPSVKYVVHCPELDLTTFGTAKMEAACRALGHERVTASGIWSAMDRGGKHWDLTFEGTALAEYRRSRLEHMNLIDLLEMLADWKAAGERHGGDMMSSIAKNSKRFGYGMETQRFLENTARDLGWA